MKFVKHASYVKKAKGDSNGALADYNKAIELKPDLAMRTEFVSQPGSGRVRDVPVTDP
jgi:hypothetical protein